MLSHSMITAAGMIGFLNSAPANRNTLPYPTHPSIVTPAYAARCDHPFPSRKYAVKVLDGKCAYSANHCRTVLLVKIVSAAINPEKYFPARITSRRTGDRK